MPTGGFGVVSISAAEKINVISSVSTVHFTDAITQNQHEMENISGLKSNRIRIHGINIESKENLHFRLWMFATKDFFNAAIDTDSFRDFVSLDIPTGAERLDTDGDGAVDGQFYYERSGMDVNYEDVDGDHTLHLLLQNVSAAAKTAGAVGAVQIDIKYSVRL